MLRADNPLSALQRSLSLQSGECCGEGKNQELLTGKKHMVAAVTILLKGGHGKWRCCLSNCSWTLKPGLLPHPSLTGKQKRSKKRGRTDPFGRPLTPFSHDGSVQADLCSTINSALLQLPHHNDPMTTVVVAPKLVGIMAS